MRSAPLPYSSDSAGIARTSRIAAARAADSHGRRITRAVQRAQKSPFPRRTSAPVTLMTRPRSSARRPISAISAGSSVTAPSTAIATTTIAPMASDRMTVELSRNSPAIEIRTVTPEKTTVAPEVRMATSSACARSLPP